MSLVGDEGRTLSIEDETGGLAASSESHIHLSFLDLVHVTVG